MSIATRADPTPTDPLRLIGPALRHRLPARHHRHPGRERRLPRRRARQRNGRGWAAAGRCLAVGPSGPISRGLTPRAWSKEPPN